jgi:hypothetical protein
MKPMLLWQLYYVAIYTNPVRARVGNEKFKIQDLTPDLHADLPDLPNDSIRWAFLKQRTQE